MSTGKPSHRGERPRRALLCCPMRRIDSNSVVRDLRKIYRYRIKGEPQKK